jgi:hypothetical protein
MGKRSGKKESGPSKRQHRLIAPRTREKKRSILTHSAGEKDRERLYTRGWHLAIPKNRHLWNTVNIFSPLALQKPYMGLGMWLSGRGEVLGVIPSTAKTIPKS